MTNTAADRLQDRLPVEVTQSLGIQPACSLVLSPAASSFTTLPFSHDYFLFVPVTRFLLSLRSIFDQYRQSVFPNRSPCHLLPPGRRRCVAPVDPGHQYGPGQGWTEETVE